MMQLNYLNDSSYQNEKLVKFKIIKCSGLLENKVMKYFN